MVKRGHVTDQDVSKKKGALLRKRHNPTNNGSYMGEMPSDSILSVWVIRGQFLINQRRLKGDKKGTSKKRREEIEQSSSKEYRGTSRKDVP